MTHRVDHAWEIVHKYIGYANHAGKGGSVPVPAEVTMGGATTVYSSQVCHLGKGLAVALLGLGLGLELAAHSFARRTPGSGTHQYP
jgi:hypothetical protein